MPKIEKGNNSVKYSQNVMKTLKIRSSTSCTQIVCEISQSQLKGFSRYFVDKVTLLYKMPKSEKGDNSAKYLQKFAKN